MQLLQSILQGRFYYNVLGGEEKQEEAGSETEGDMMGEEEGDREERRRRKWGKGRGGEAGERQGRTEWGG